MRLNTLSLAALLGTTMLASPAFAQPLSTVSDQPAAQAATAPEAAAAPDTPADAQGTVNDITVYGRRRAERAQDVPLAISAVNQERLAEAHVTNIADITNLVPSVNFVRNTTNPTSLFPFIRGFGSKSTDPATEPPISLSVDGIYVGTLIGAFINLADVESVEVSRGPQGTLLGKNAPAGAVSIRTRRPGPDLGGNFMISYGSWNDLILDASLDVPIVSDHLLSTISYHRERSDGYMHNLTTGEDIGGIGIDSFRVGLLADLGDVTWYVTGQYTHDSGEDAGDRNVSDFTPLAVPTAIYCPYTQAANAAAVCVAGSTGAPPPVTLTCTQAFSRTQCLDGTLPNRRRYTTAASAQSNRDSWLASLTSNLDWSAGPVTFASVTGWREFRELANPDIDGTPQTIIDAKFDGHYRQFQQELRVSSTSGGGLDAGGRLNWLLGAFFYNLDYDRFNRQIVLGAPSTTYQEGITNSYALFAHAEYEVVDHLFLSGGIRQTWDRKTHASCAQRCFTGIDPTFTQRANWDNFSYDGTVEYRFTRDNMIYARYATGYRGGGFTGVPATVAGVAQFDPETVKSFELGVKNDFFDHRLRVNVQVYRNDFQDLQRTISVPITTTPFFIQLPQNIANGRTQGVDVEITARPVPALTLRANVGYLDASYTDFFANLTSSAANPATDNTALRFPYTSEWTLQLGATYEAELGDAGSLSLSADYAYRSRLNTTDLNFAFGEQPGYGLLSATVTWHDPSRRFSVSVYGRNLTDEAYIDGGDGIGGLSTYVTDGPPQSFGASFGFRF